MKKYELTSSCIKLESTKLFQIRALMDFSDVRAGDMGGYIESEDNLAHTGNSWVYGNASVAGNAWVAETPGSSETPWSWDRIRFSRFLESAPSVIQQRFSCVKIGKSVSPAAASLVTWKPLPRKCRKRMETTAMGTCTDWPLRWPSNTSRSPTQAHLINNKRGDTRDRPLGRRLLCRHSCGGAVRQELEAQRKAALRRADLPVQPVRLLLGYKRVFRRAIQPVRWHGQQADFPAGIARLHTL